MLNATCKSLFAAFAIAAAATAFPHGGAAHDGHTTFSAGEPGDPKKPARLVEVVMMERPGEMSFFPKRIEIKRGEQIKFIVRNTGALTHEFILATTAENLKHAEEMKKNPEMEHDDPNGKTVESKKVTEFVWRFSKAGEFEYGCLIPGHREAGMTGTVIVK
jgi:uncharacterized cupredoxin-like copper-binding protein